MTKELSIEEMMELSGDIEDQTQEVSHGDFDNKPKEGITVGRLISYIELGKHDGGAFQGKKKPDADKVLLEFELLGPDNLIEWEVEGVKKVAGQVIPITIKKSQSDKSGYRKLFKKMVYGREDKNHLAKCLGEAFVLEVFHNVVKKEGQKDVTYANLHKDGEWSVRAPYELDAISKQKKYYDVPERTRALRLFLWDKPQQSSWDALFIDGVSERKVKDAAGVETTVTKSKNWLQERILSAKNYAGSKLQHMLNGVANLPATEEAAQAQEKVVESAPGVAQEQQKEAAPVAQAETPTQQAAPADPLAALGFK